MLTFTRHLLLTSSNLPCLIHGPDISGSYAILLFIALDLASITSHIHNWVLFLLWLHPFILSGVLSPLISSGILTWGVPLSVSYHFAFSYCSWVSDYFQFHTFTDNAAINSIACIFFPHVFFFTINSRVREKKLFS